MSYKVKPINWIKVEDKSAGEWWEADLIHPYRHEIMKFVALKTGETKFVAFPAQGVGRRQFTDEDDHFDTLEEAKEFIWKLHEEAVQRVMKALVE